jgi:hypothetical protein
MGEYVPVAGKGANGLPGMGGVYNSINMHMFAYAGNNPIVYIDPDGEFLVWQFIFAALQTIGGGAEVAAVCVTAAGTGGLSLAATAYGIIDGGKNFADGIVGMIYAANDKEYNGVAATITGTVLRSTTNWSDSQIDTASSVASLVDGAISMRVTSAAKLGANADIIRKGIDAAGNLNSAADVVSNGITALRESSSSPTNTRPAQTAPIYSRQAETGAPARTQSTTTSSVQTTYMGPGIPSSRTQDRAPPPVQRGYMGPPGSM